LIFVGRWGGAPAIAATQAGLGFAAMFADLFLLRRAVRITGTDIVGCLYRPVIAAIAMVLVLQLLDQTMNLSLFAAMLTKTVCGAIAYIGTLTLVWVLSGRPDGIEALGLEIAAKIVGRRRAHRLT
jgi:hypothetical protein